MGIFGCQLGSPETSDNGYQSSDQKKTTVTTILISFRFAWLAACGTDSVVSDTTAQTTTVRPVLLHESCALSNDQWEHESMAHAPNAISFWRASLCCWRFIGWKLHAAGNIGGTSLMLHVLQLLAVGISGENFQVRLHAKTSTFILVPKCNVRPAPAKQ